MHDAKTDAIKRDHFVVLVIGLRRTADELGTGRSEIAAAAGGRIVAVAGRRRTRMEILRFRKVLPNEARSDNFTVQGHKTAIRLSRKDELGYAGHHGWIEESGQNCESER